jgi:hypothetical protein
MPKILTPTIYAVAVLSDALETHYVDPLRLHTRRDRCRKIKGRRRRAPSSRPSGGGKGIGYWDTLARMNVEWLKQIAAEKAGAQVNPDLLSSYLLYIAFLYTNSTKQNQFTVTCVFGLDTTWSLRTLQACSRILDFHLSLRDKSERACERGVVGKIQYCRKLSLASPVRQVWCQLCTIPTAPTK